MKTEIEFAEDCVTIQAMYLDGQKYRLTGAVPHQKIDGSFIMLSTWEAECAVCGAAFEVRSSRRTTTHLTRRCQEHKAPGKPVVDRTRNFARRGKPA